MTDVDPWVRDAVELIASKDRALAQKDLEIYALVTALSVHEGRDIHTTALVHLGRPYVSPWGGE